MPDRACLRDIAGPFRPSAAEHLVQRHQVRQLRQLIRDELLLRRIERPLRGQQREETVRAGSVARLREIVVVLRRRRGSPTETGSPVNHPSRVRPQQARGCADHSALPEMPAQ